MLEAGGGMFPHPPEETGQILESSLLDSLSCLQICPAIG